MTSTPPQNFLKEAFQIASHAHLLQWDVDGQPHIMHCLRIAQNVATETQRAIAYLHDTIEDVPERLDWKAFGRQPDDVQRGVYLMTKYPGEPYEQYRDRIIKSKDLDTLMVKIEDTQDNLRRMCPEKEHLRGRYLEAVSLLRAAILSIPIPPELCQNSPCK